MAAQVPPGAALNWGHNSHGQLGNGNVDDSHTPLSVTPPAGVTITEVAGGVAHSIALTDTGRVLAWGNNSMGQLGISDAEDSTVPVYVAFPEGAVATEVVAGAYHSLALTAAGDVLAWGLNGSGQLGDGTMISSPVPVQVSLPAGVAITGIAAGGLHSLALTSTGQVLAWGHNGAGQLGDGTVAASALPSPVRFPPGHSAREVAAGGGHSLAITGSGEVVAWGDNSTGQLGDGTVTARLLPTPVRLPAGLPVRSVAAGGGHSVAVTAGGRMLSWGDNEAGQLGADGVVTSTVPVVVSQPPGVAVARVEAGGVHNLALTPAGEVLAWGGNDEGQLGTGDESGRSQPVQAPLPDEVTVTGLAAGWAHSLVVTP